MTIKLLDSSCGDILSQQQPNSTQLNNLVADYVIDFSSLSSCCNKIIVEADDSILTNSQTITPSSKVTYETLTGSSVDFVQYNFSGLNTYTGKTNGPLIHDTVRDRWYSCSVPTVANQLLSADEDISALLTLNSLNIYDGDGLATFSATNDTIVISAIPVIFQKLTNFGNIHGFIGPMFQFQGCSLINGDFTNSYNNVEILGCSGSLNYTYENYCSILNSVLSSIDSTPTPEHPNSLDIIHSIISNSLTLENTKIRSNYSWFNGSMNAKNTEFLCQNINCNWTNQTVLRSCQLRWYNSDVVSDSLVKFTNNTNCEMYGCGFITTNEIQVIHLSNVHIGGDWNDIVGTFRMRNLIVWYNSRVKTSERSSLVATNTATNRSDFDVRYNSELVCEWGTIGASNVSVGIYEFYIESSKWSYSFNNGKFFHSINSLSGGAIMKAINSEIKMYVSSNTSSTYGNLSAGLILDSSVMYFCRSGGTTYNFNGTGANGSIWLTNGSKLYTNFTLINTTGNEIKLGSSASKAFVKNTQFNSNATDECCLVLDCDQNTLFANPEDLP
jgi:hypothetical protein